MKKMMWTIFKWPQWILDEKESSLGVRFASKLSTLEGLGCLTQLAVGHKELKGLQVKIHCDNAGFVFAMSSGSSTCLYVATISKALHDLAQGLDIALRVVKTGRMSGPGERAADALSKGDMQRALLDIGTVKEKMPRRAPKTIVEWVSDPVPDPQLGHRILEELRGQEENREWEKIRLTVSDVREAAVLSLEEGKRARVWIARLMYSCWGPNARLFLGEKGARSSRRVGRERIGPDKRSKAVVIGEKAFGEDRARRRRWRARKGVERREA